MVHFSKKSYYTKLFDELMQNTKKTWNVLNEISGKKKDHGLEQFKRINNGMKSLMTWILQSDST